ncbi:uncharacterized protein Dwil_GK17899 [Drosophila willistoni]|uniref:Protein TsetseEP domain-containing protein n=1 Tax=Drosophila willistoni TaxID=7260 RepID=B4N5M4_DROWI|nr:uncharacterized protein LOC6646200 [Drosophila willistoni]EDW79663.1 uncharacterized protein Dwil_GK17899 [Drosophila willistoni]
MFSKLSVLLVCLCAGNSLALTHNLDGTHLFHLTLKNHVKIQRLQVETETLAEAHQDKTTTCFNHYTPIFSNLTNQYEYDYNVCLDNYDNASEIIDAKYAPARNQFQNTILESCKSLYGCNVNSTSNYTAFDCIAEHAAEQSKALYNLSANGTEISAKIKEEYRVIDVQKEICINNAEWIYVVESADTYEELNTCLRGDLIIVTPGPDIPGTSLITTTSDNTPVPTAPVIVDAPPTPS